MPTVSGVYSLPPSYKATSGQNIRTEQHNPPLEDIAKALTDRLPRDGSAPMTGDLNMNGNRLTGIGAGSSPGDAVTFGQLSGMIVMWSGAVVSIPAGWSLCDGNNGTPDLRGRFIVGAGGVYAVGDKGGAENVTLTGAQMPQHIHAFGGTTSPSGDHSHTYANGGTGGGGFASLTNGFGSNTATSAAGNHTHTVSGNTGSSGGGEAHENRPPYYALCFIRKN